MDSHEAAALGIARTFQNIALFKGMTVLDNIMTGRNLKMRCNFLQQAFWLGPAKREELEHRRAVEEIIDFLEIQHIRKTPVGRLPYGLQKRVELARALAAEPKLLLLDEPMAGMNLEEKQDMCRFILDVNDQFGTTIVLIEHDMGVVMDISDRVVVLDYGRKIADGTPEEVRARPGGHRRLPRRRRTEAAGRMDFAFFIEVLVGGLLAGVMYSLVALGFVLIYKASGVFNFAQGAMVFFAALTFVSLVERGVNVWLALVVTLAVMVRARPRHRARGAAAARQPAADHAVHGDHRPHLRARGPVAARLGLAAARPRARHPRRADGVAVAEGEHQHQPVRPVRRGVAGVLVAVLAVFFQKTRIGRALRAVADDHQAALAVGIPLQHIWAIVWAVAGFVALVAGLMWGVRNGVQFALTFVALKALPVLILGGFESIPGAIIGGLIIGATEKLAEVYLGPYVGGGIESLVRLRGGAALPAGPAGGPVRREAHRQRVA